MKTKKTLDGELYIVTGASGREYMFKMKDISLYPLQTHLLITDSIVVYIFVDSVTKETPTLIEMGYRSDWTVWYKDIENYERIKNNGATNFLFLTGKKEGIDIYIDILDGTDFNRNLLL